MSFSPKNGLPYLAPQQAQKHVTANESLRRLDQLVQASVLSKTVAAEPAGPADGDAYILPPGKTGAHWGSMAAHSLAAFQDGAWREFPPKTGWLVFNDADGKFYAFSAGSWSELAGGGSGFDPDPEFNTIGVNAAADAANRVAVAAPATLLNHDGAGHQLKINKAAAGDTGSILFQTASSGRAEIGLAGDDNFHFKVSPDGSSWTEAIQIDRATGIVTLTAGSVGAAALANDAVTNAKLANMAQSTIKGRAAGAGTGDPQDLTATQATAILDAVVGDSGSGGTKGLAPAPASGDAAAGKFLKADGTWAVPPGSGGGPEILSANRTYYVRTDGSNSNTGLADSAGGAFLTIAKALSVASALVIPSGITVTINVGGSQSGARDFAEDLALNGPWLGGGTVILQGDTTTPSNRSITCASVCITLNHGARLEVKGIQFKKTGSGGAALSINSASRLKISGKVDFAAFTSGYHQFVSDDAEILIDAAYTISGGADVHGYCNRGTGSTATR